MDAAYHRRAGYPPLNRRACNCGAEGDGPLVFRSYRSEGEPVVACTSSWRRSKAQGGDEPSR